MYRPWCTMGRLVHPAGYSLSPSQTLHLFTNILAERRQSETENGIEYTRFSGKAENVGPYENPFRLKNGLVRNPLGAQGRKGGRRGDEEGKKKKERKVRKKSDHKDRTRNILETNRGLLYITIENIQARLDAILVNHFGGCERLYCVNRCLIVVGKSLRKGIYFI